MELKFDNVSKSYGKTKALVGFSATLTSGIYALLGPNGSGKSTLMNILTQNLRADEGGIYFDGENTSKMGARFRERLGFMPQYPGLYPAFGVEEFLWYTASLKGMSKEDAARSIPEVLEAVELSDVAKHKIRSMSGGMKQRLALAQATLGSPDILILDEPTAGLDPKQRIAIRNYISSIALQKIVIIATHVVSDVEFIAKEAIILKKGHIQTIAKPEELTTSMDGKVWTVDVSESEVAAYEEKHTVTNIAKTETGATLRILSDVKFSEKASPAKPTLEDYYLYVFGREDSSQKS